MPKVSVIVVNYNYSKYLDERVQSLLNQTYQDFELLIIDNGSTDNSVEILEKYKSDSRVFLKCYPDNKSPWERWNDGVDATDSDYVMIVASDDSCDSRLLEKLVEKLDNYPSVGFAYAQSWEVDDQGQRLYLSKVFTDPLDPNLWATDFVANGQEMCRYMLSLNFIRFSGLARRSVFVKAGKFDTQLPYEADWMLWSKILVNSDLAFVAEPLLFGRMHTSSLGKTVKDSLVLQGRLEVIRYLLSKIQPPETFCEAVYKPIIRYWMSLIFSGKTTLSTNLKIYKLLMDIDPRINYYLIEKAFKGVNQKLNHYQKVFLPSGKTSP